VRHKVFLKKIIRISDIIPFILEPERNLKQCCPDLIGIIYSTEIFSGVTRENSLSCCVHSGARFCPVQCSDLRAVIIAEFHSFVLLFAEHKTPQSLCWNRALPAKTKEVTGILAGRRGGEGQKQVSIESVPSAPLPRLPMAQCSYPHK